MKKFAQLVALGVLGAFATLAQAQPYATWSNYRDVTINTTAANGGADVADDLTDYPVLVRLTDDSDATGANVLSEALSGGADIRFSNAAGTEELAYEIDHWSETSAAIWVKVPEVEGDDNTTIRMYWGRPGTLDASDGESVFETSNGFLGVWHMGGEEGQPRLNASSPANAAVPAATGGDYEGRSVPGIIGMADSLAGGGSGGTGEHFDLGAGFSDFSEGLSFSMWTYITTSGGGNITGNWWRWFDIGNGPGQDEIWLGRNAGSSNLTFENATSGTGDRTTLDDVIITDNANRWMHIVVTVGEFDGGIAPVNVYMDGGEAVETGESDAGAFPVVERLNNYLGRSNWAADAFYRGLMDEPRMSDVEHSPDWVKLDYELQKEGATALTLGSSETQDVKAMFYSEQRPTYLVNVEITPNEPVVDGSASGWEIVSGTLPEGLDFSTSDGVISGTPTEVAEEAQVVVEATVDASEISDTLLITITAGDPPDAPTNVVADPGNSEVTVTWSAPAVSGTTPITSYHVHAVEDTTKDCEWTTEEEDLTCTVTDLENGTPYTFVVFAISSVGPSEPSSASAEVTPATTPGVPTNVVASQLSGAGGTATATVSWTAPETDGGAAISGSFVIGDPSGACFAPGTDTSCTVASLQYETEYTFRVYANNSVGAGDTSDASEGLTPVNILPGSFAIHANGNPFTFVLSQDALASTEAFTMSINDIWGRTVWSRTIHPAKDNKDEVSWNGRNTSGRPVSAGMYIVRVATVSGGTATNYVQKAISTR